MSDFKSIDTMEKVKNVDGESGKTKKSRGIPSSTFCRHAESYEAVFKVYIIYLCKFTRLAKRFCEKGKGSNTELVGLCSSALANKLIKKSIS